MKEISKEQRIKNIATRIKELRIKSGYTSYERFAIKAEIDRKQFWRLEEGANFRIASLFPVLKELDISLAEFFEGLD